MGESMISIYNCGQGDAARLNFDRCVWDDVPLLIDLGPASFTFESNFDIVDLLITHSHDDHVLGHFKVKPKIRTLFVPAYYPEYRKIIRKLTKQNSQLVIDFDQLVQLVYEGANIGNCGHCEVFNPPIDPLAMFGLTEVDEDYVESYLRRYELSVESLLAVEDRDLDVQRPQDYQPMLFAKAMISLIAKRDKGSIDKAIHEFIRYDANKMSIVFRYRENNEEGTSYLFTGDADESVFRRILKQDESRLRSTVIKMPHHGSKNNINVLTLKQINPSVAIISHNNGLFGSSIDPHPNQGVLDIMSKLSIRAYFTNDVIKNTVRRNNAHTGRIESLNIEIV